MRDQRFFSNIYQQLSGVRLAVIIILLTIGVGILYFFNTLGQALEDREKKYASLYAESIRFFLEQGLDSTCDYTFVSDVVDANETIPVIVVADGEPRNHKNIPELQDSSKVYTPDEIRKILLDNIEQMKLEHEPILIKINDVNNAEVDQQVAYLYYSSSFTLKELKFFPYILLSTFLIFGSLAFIAYSSSRRAEQNRVWVGLAKETAHQLGTPISGLHGWIGLLRSMEGVDQSIGDEMEKDILRLETITTRFSNIGSVPSMKKEAIGKLIEETYKYLQIRISTKIEWEFNNELSTERLVELNKNLFEWVIENLCKNAVDAMAGIGHLQIRVFEIGNSKIGIDIKDTGKGMTKNQIRKIFNPGFTTKKRGWGLGLTLAKRIIEVYHGGKLYVQQSEPGKGTTFRIMMQS